jgi:hypothetical protein
MIDAEYLFQSRHKFFLLPSHGVGLQLFGLLHGKPAGWKRSVSLVVNSEL